jgi:hypothetical protein
VDCAEPLSIFRTPAAQRSRAERQHADMPWLSVKLPWGLKGRLINISSTGLLLESGSKLTPGSITELTLCGPGTELSVAVSFVRSELAEIDRLSVKYHTAVTFKEPLKLLEVPAAAPRDASPRGALRALLADAAEELARSTDLDLRAALERSVSRTVGAERVRICDEPAAPGGGDAWISFPVPVSTAPFAVLHAWFGPGHEPDHDGLTLLRAAAGLSGIALEYDALSKTPA